MKEKEKTRIRHNCTKEGKFKFTTIAFTKDTRDVIECEICGRRWEELR